MYYLFLANMRASMDINDNVLWIASIYCNIRLVFNLHSYVDTD